MGEEVVTELDLKKNFMALALFCCSNKYAVFINEL